MSNKKIIKKLLLLILTSCFVIYAKWELVGLKGVPVTTIDTDPSLSAPKAFIGTAGKGIYRYEFAMDTLFPFYSSNTDSFELYMRDVKASSFDKGVYYVGTDSGLCLYSMGGTNKWIWHKMNGIPQEPVYAIAGANRSLFFVATKEKIYKSSMSSIDWRPVPVSDALPSYQSVPFFDALHIHQHNGTNLYAGSHVTSSWSSWFGAVSSSDEGNSWTENNQSLVPPVNAVYSYASYNDTNCFFFAGTDKGVFRQIVGLSRWERYKPGPLDGQQVNDLHLSNYGTLRNTELFACTKNGAYLLSAYPEGSMDDAQWRDLALGKKSNCAYAFPYFSSHSYWLVGTDDGLYKYTRDISFVKNPNNKKLATTIVVQQQKNIFFLKNIDNKVVTLCVYNLQGRLIKQHNNKGTKAILDLSQLSQGMYLVGLLAKNGSVQHTFHIKNY